MDETKFLNLFMSSLNPDAPKGTSQTKYNVYKNNKIDESEIQTQTPGKKRRAKGAKKESTVGRKLKIKICENAIYKCQRNPKSRK